MTRAEAVDALTSIKRILRQVAQNGDLPTTFQENAARAVKLADDVADFVNARERD